MSPTIRRNSNCPLVHIPGPLSYTYSNYLKIWFISDKGEVEDVKIKGAYWFIHIVKRVTKAKVDLIFIRARGEM